jgi:hypothetical protein
LFGNMRGGFSKFDVYVYSNAIVKCAHFEGKLYLIFASLCSSHNIYYVLQIRVLL